MFARYDYTVQHVPGKSPYIANTLSRAPVAMMGSEDKSLQDEVEMFVDSVIHYSLPATHERLNVYRQAQAQDAVCQLLAEYSKKGWPAKRSVRQDVAPFWKSRKFLTECDGLVLFDTGLWFQRHYSGKPSRKSILDTRE